MLKSYGVGGWVVVASRILVSAQALVTVTESEAEAELDNKIMFSD